jgi:hypothetical protein
VLEEAHWSPPSPIPNSGITYGKSTSLSDALPWRHEERSEAHRPSSAPPEARAATQVPSSAPLDSHTPRDFPSLSPRSNLRESSRASQTTVSRHYESFWSSSDATNGSREAILCSGSPLRGYWQGFSNPKASFCSGLSSNLPATSAAKKTSPRCHSASCAPIPRQHRPRGMLHS